MAVRINEITNPSFETNILGWSPYSAGPNHTITRDATQAFKGSASMKIDAPVETIDAGTWFEKSLPAGNYVASAWVKTGANVSNMHFVLRKSDFTVLGEIHITTPNTDWQRISFPFSLGATDTIQLLWGLGSYGPVSFGTAWIDGVMIEKVATLADYFDGDTPDAGGVDYAWTGTAHGSTSTATSADPLPAAPGMFDVSVDSNRAFVSWNSPASENITGFKLYRNVNGGSFTLLASPTTSYYDDTTVTNGNTYQYKVAAVNSGGEGTQTAAKTAVPGAPSKQTDAWYANGVQPTGMTLATLQSQFATKVANWIAYCWTQVGAEHAGTGAWRVKAPDQTFYSPTGNSQYNATVSEGIAYGMVLSAYMSNPASKCYDIKAKSRFNGLLAYYNAHKNVRGLMNWHIDPNGGIGDSGGATDADHDAAWACLVMDRIHGSSGSVNYNSEGMAIADAVKAYEFTPAAYGGVGGPNVMLNGDQWGNDADFYMPDYFAPQAYRWFKQEDGDNRWDDIITKNYNLAIQFFYDNFPTGFVPDNSTRAGAAISGRFYGYGWNSIRHPIRIGLDYFWNGITLAKNNLTRMANFTKTAASNTPANTKAEWNLPGTTNAGYTNQAFAAGYAIAGATDATTAQWAADLLAWVQTNFLDEQHYFGPGVASMCMLVLSGEAKNFAPNAGVTTSSITKQLKYTVERTPTAITKLMRYRVRTIPTAITKQLRYRVERPMTPVTKSMTYTVSTALNLETDLIEFRAMVPITKQLRYAVRPAATALTKQLKYVVKRANAITKSLRYTVERTITAITKQLRYVVESSGTIITKQLRYTVRPASVGITKQLKYTVERVLAITKSLTYRVRNLAAITKSMKYTVRRAPAAITKGLRYTIKKAQTAITKSLTYKVERGVAITKQLRYRVEITPTIITKQMKYAVRPKSVITKQLRYDVHPGVPHVITKQLKYAIRKYPYKPKPIKPYVRQTIRPFLRKPNPYVKIPKN